MNNNNEETPAWQVNWNVVPMASSKDPKDDPTWCDIRFYDQQDIPSSQGGYVTVTLRRWCTLVIVICVVLLTIIGVAILR